MAMSRAARASRHTNTAPASMSRASQQVRQHAVESPCRRSRSWFSSDEDRLADAGLLLQTKRGLEHLAGRTLRTRRRGRAGRRRARLPAAGRVLQRAEPHARADAREEPAGEPTALGERRLHRGGRAGVPAAEVGAQRSRRPAPATGGAGAGRGTPRARSSPRSSISSVRKCPGEARRTRPASLSGAGSAATSSSATGAGSASRHAPLRLSGRRSGTSRPLSLAITYKRCRPRALLRLASTLRRERRRGVARIVNHGSAQTQRLARLAAVYPQQGIARDPSRYCKLPSTGGDACFVAAVLSDPKPGDRPSPSMFRRFDRRLTVNRSARQDSRIVRHVLASSGQRGGDAFHSRPKVLPYFFSTNPEGGDTWPDLGRKPSERA